MQNSPGKELPQFRSNKKFNKASFFPTEDPKPLDSKMIIVKSFSAERKQSLTLQSFFRKCSQSTTARFKVRVKTEAPPKEEIDLEKRQSSRQPDNKSLFNCAEQLQRYRKMEKDDIFSKLSEVQRKLSRQVRHAKNRQNRRYIVQSKANRLKYYNNPINLTGFSSIITVKHITSAVRTPEDQQRTKRISFNQPKIIRLLHRGFLKEEGSKTIPWAEHSQLQHHKKRQRQLQNQQFSGWKTQQDFDF